MSRDLADDVGEELPVVRRVHTAREFGEALAVRRAVFVVEQGGPEEDEPDEHDPEALHYLLLWQGRTVGTARLILNGEPGAAARFGRLCVLSEWRGRGWGTLLLREVVERARQAGAGMVVAHAQTQALEFYLRQGFEGVGAPFEEAGILHRRIQRRLDAAVAGAGEEALDEA
jgi:predicted GNAT family N-acyltransferase